MTEEEIKAIKIDSENFLDAISDQVAFTECSDPLDNSLMEAYDLIVKLCDELLRTRIK